MGYKKSKQRRGEPKVNEHHLFYTHHEWNDVGRWGKLLRNHPYYKKIIPIKNLHDSIHRQVPLIPPPDNQSCKFIYEATEEAIMRHEINIQCDTIEQRIDFFLAKLNLLKDDGDYTATILALQKQRKIVADYYAKRSSKNSYQNRKIPIYSDRAEKFYILFPAKIWGVKGYGKILSENSYFVIRVPKSLINEIRRNIREIKKPRNGYSLKNVNQKLEHDRKAKRINPSEDSLSDRIYFLIEAFRQEGELATAEDLERMLEVIELFYKRH